jgi:hypothetical protein
VRLSFLNPSSDTRGGKIGLADFPT